MNHFTGVKTDWDFKKTLGYQNISDPKIKKDLAKAKKESYKFIKKWRQDSSYLSSITSLKTALDEYEYWLANFATCANVDYYLSLKQALKQNNSGITALLNSVVFSARHIENDIQFFLLHLAKIDKKQQQKFLKSARLKPYRNFLKNLFLIGQHTLSDDQEKILNLKRGVSRSNWIKMTTRLLSKKMAKVYSSSGKLTNMPFSSINALIDHSNKKVRQTATEAITEILDSLADVAESELNSVLENKMINDQLRGYARPDSARHLSDDIDTKIVDTLISTVTNNFHLSRQYYRQKVKLLGKEKIDYSARNLTVGKLNISFDVHQSVEIVDRVFKKLDPEFSQIFNDFLKNGHIDFFSKQGKTGGAFCSAGLKNATSFVLLNHNKKLTDTITIAHEMGHAINNELVRLSQNALNSGTTLATIEVASKFFEDFVVEDIKKRLGPKQRQSILLNKLDKEVNSVFRQIALYNFETDLHALFRKKGYLSKKIIGNLFTRHMTAYLGSSVRMDGFQNWWVYWSHIRRPFYVYSYTSGLLISKHLQSQVIQNPKYIQKVKMFLSSGTSQSPRQIFKNLGIDIGQASFWQQGINRFADKLEQIRKSAV